ncbi:MAG: phosphoribosylamine--glycine ligase, partial [Bacteroidetes bacterium]|nr:phosphoribosylamine--glycine ligase [Bacteroidota bacterium]
MNILVLGSGGREYMLAWKIRKSKSVDNLYIAPGNGGTADLGKNVNIDWQNLGSFVHFIKTKKINMLVVGPEMPLVDGLVDRLKSISSLSDLMIVGPGKAAARLEGSKAFAKTFMEKHDIPTAQHKTFTKAQSAEAVKYIQSNEGPYVLKADGLAGGKGVVILSDTNEAVQEAQAILNGKFGHAGNILVIESFL